ncbi:MAG TPA: hypothetical protein PLD60_18170, partial [Leptospiraceae bacterium]|nr:hypothetical protein [Leptospiraceae bacterium]
MRVHGAHVVIDYHPALLCLSRNLRPGEVTLSPRSLPASDRWENGTLRMYSDYALDITPIA